MKKKKVKLLRVIIKILETENLQILVGLTFLAILFIYSKNDAFKFSTLFDLTLITSFVFLYIIKIISGLLSAHLGNYLEDCLKLETDNDRLIKKYPLEENFVTYNNELCAFKEYALDKSDSKTWKEEKEESYNYKFPIIIVYEGSNISINDAKNRNYKLPEVVKKHYISLFNAHSTSDIYNQVNIRLDNYRLQKEDNYLHLYTSRTTYYDSLVTNRAIDFEFKKGLTLRELINPGPFIMPLDKSRLSNHLGFNVFIETQDGDIIFVKRNMNVSIGKGTLGPSVSASLKTRYCLDDDLTFTLEGLVDAVKKEIEDELGIKEVEISIKDNLIAVYRDILEGGKPQFLFKVKINNTSCAVRENFKKYLKTKNNKYDTIMDGNKLVFIKISDIKKIYIAPDAIFFNPKEYDIHAEKYNILPSIGGIFAYFINNERKNEN